MDAPSPLVFRRHNYFQVQKLISLSHAFVVPIPGPTVVNHGAG